jgi:hypothetical protein
VHVLCFKINSTLIRKDKRKCQWILYKVYLNETYTCICCT